MYDPDKIRTFLSGKDSTQWIANYTTPPQVDSDTFIFYNNSFVRFESTKPYKPRRLYSWYVHQETSHIFDERPESYLILLGADRVPRDSISYAVYIADDESFIELTKEVFRMMDQEEVITLEQN